jgi:AraC-like DNA-binding protein
MRRDQHPSWSRLAIEAGYYDQAHLIREVRVLSGATPAELAAETRAVGFVQYESDVPL